MTGPDIIKSKTVFNKELTVEQTLKEKVTIHCKRGVTEIGSKKSSHNKELGS